LKCELRLNCPHRTHLSHSQSYSECENKLIIYLQSSEKLIEIDFGMDER